MTRRSRISLGFIALFTFLAAGAVFLLIKTDHESNAIVTERPRRVAVQVRELVPRPYTQTIEAYATVAPFRKGTVSAEVGGPLARLAPGVDAGEPVQRGQELARIQDIRYRIALQKAEAALRKFRALLEIEQNENEKRASLYRIAEQRLALARSDYDRKRLLFDKDLIAKQTLEAAESEMELRRSEFERARSELQNRRARIESIRADVASADAEIRRIKEDLADTIIVAPFDGLIGRRFVEVGDQVSPGQPLFTVLDISRVKVLARVPSEQVDKIKPGTLAEVNTQAYASRPFKGKVVNLYPEADLKNRTFSVEIQVTNRGQRLLLPGMFARVRIPVLTLSRALLAPRDAILEDDGGPHLYVVDRSTRTARRRNVILGEVGADEALIRAGVDAGELVVLRGQELLQDGAKVTWESVSPNLATSESSQP